MTKNNPKSIRTFFKWLVKKSHFFRSGKTDGTAAEVHFFLHFFHPYIIAGFRVVIYHTVLW